MGPVPESQSTGSGGQTPPPTPPLKGRGEVCSIIGEGAPLGWPHPFTLDRLDAPTDRATPHAPEVLFVHTGTLNVAWDDGVLTLGAGDTMTVPVEVERTLSGDAVVYRVSGVG